MVICWRHLRRGVRLQAWPIVWGTALPPAIWHNRRIRLITSPANQLTTTPTTNLVLLPKSQGSCPPIDPAADSLVQITLNSTYVGGVIVDTDMLCVDASFVLSPSIAGPNCGADSDASSASIVDQKWPILWRRIPWIHFPQGDGRSICAWIGKTIDPTHQDGKVPHEEHRTGRFTPILGL